MNLLKALELRKAKYIKRTGGPGNYKYWYKDASGKLVSGAAPKSSPSVQTKGASPKEMQNKVTVSRSSPKAIRTEGMKKPKAEASKESKAPSKKETVFGVKGKKTETQMEADPKRDREIKKMERKTEKEKAKKERDKKKKKDKKKTKKGDLANKVDRAGGFEGKLKRGGGYDENHPGGGEVKKSLTKALRFRQGKVISLEEALELRKAGAHKYIRKEGSGKTARYWYKDASGKVVEGKKPTKSQGKKKWTTGDLTDLGQKVYKEGGDRKKLLDKIEEHQLTLNEAKALEAGYIFAQRQEKETEKKGHAPKGYAAAVLKQADLRNKAALERAVDRLPAADRAAAYDKKDAAPKKREATKGEEAFVKVAKDLFNSISEDFNRNVTRESVLNWWRSAGLTLPTSRKLSVDEADKLFRVISEGLQRDVTKEAVFRQWQASGLLSTDGKEKKKGSSFKPGSKVVLDSKIINKGKTDEHKVVSIILENGSALHHMTFDDEEAAKKYLEKNGLKQVPKPSDW